jgi:hypothetical protein
MGSLQKQANTSENVAVVLKRGTPDELSFFFSFISKPDADSLYQVSY